MRRILNCTAAALAVVTGACETPVTPSDILDPQEGPIPGVPSGNAFTLGEATLLTGSASDAWPELEGDHVAWYRAAPAEEEGVWLMDLRTGEATRIWSGTVYSAFDLVDGEIFWGSAEGLHSYRIDSGTLNTLATAYRYYRDVSVGPRYIVGTARQSSDRPFVYDRESGTEWLIPTPTSVPATRGWEDWVLYSDHRETLQERQLYLHHIPTGEETRITDQDQLLTTANADLSANRVVYFARRFCPGSLELYDMGARTTGAVDLPGICPTVVLLDGDLLVYRHNASGGIIYLGFLDLGSGDQVELRLQNPGNWRIDADLDGTRAVHTSANGLTLVDLRFQARQPPVADAGGPYLVDEGAPLTLDAGGSYSPSGATLSYRWTLPDGTVLDGASPSWTWPDDGEFDVALTVTDSEGESAGDVAEVTVLNRPPNVTVGGTGIRVASGTFSLSGVAGETVTLLGSFDDPGLQDAPWRWSVSWDGGELASGTLEDQGALPPVTWTPAEPGTFTVVVEVEDKDGGATTLEVSLVVERAPLPPLRVHAGSGEQHNVPALNSSGVFPVVAFGMPEAHARDFDVATFRLGPASAAPLMEGGQRPRLEDRDGDGLDDLVLTFRVPEVGLSPGDAEVCLAGATVAGDALHGCSPIRIAGGGGR
jgi:hypothetical protein